jgi:hypothetical protein
VNSTSIECYWRGGPIGIYYLEAFLDNVTVNYGFLSIAVGIFIQVVHPQFGSLGGGYILTIEGSHFLQLNQTVVEIEGVGHC